MSSNTVRDGLVRERSENTTIATAMQQVQGNRQESHDTAMAHAIVNTYAEKTLDDTKRTSGDRLAKERELGWWGRTKSGIIYYAAKATGYVSADGKDAVLDYRAKDVAQSALAHNMRK